MRVIICTLLLFIVSTIAYSQTQSGYIRTLSSSKRHGSPIPNATIKLKGLANDVVSNKKGTFVLPMTGKKEGEPYQLLNVIKGGYEFADKDFLSRRFAYSSKIPLEIVMISSEELAKQKQEIENRTYITVQKGYEGKIQLLEKQRETGTISIKEYTNRLTELRLQFDNFEAIISDVADYYARVDFEKLDSIDAIISTCILEGDLIRADKLIAQKGSLDERIANYHKHKETNNEARILLDSLTYEVSRQRDSYEKERDDIANDLYNKYTIALSFFEMDKAGEYISLRSEMDTTNIKWMYDAGMFYYYRTGNYEKAASLLKKAAILSNTQYGGWGMLSALIIKNLALCYAALGDNNLTATTYNDAIIICSHFKGMESVDVAEVYSSYATYLNKMGEYQNALDHIAKAVEIKERFYEQDNPKMLITYNNMGMTLYYQKRYEDAMDYFNKSLAILEKNNMKVDANIATLYNNIGTLYSHLSSFDKAEVFLNLALENRKRIWGERHRDVANTYNNIGGLYMSKGEFESALSNYVRSYNIYKEIYGDNTDAALSLSNVGRVYDGMIDYRCVEYYAKALSIYWESSMNKNNETIKETATLFYNSYCNGLKNGMIDFCQQYFDEFIKRYVVLLSVEGQDSPAFSQGMRGDYILLGVNEWSMNKPESFASVITRNAGKPKSLVVYDDSGFNKFTFADRIGAKLELLYLGEEKVSSLIKEYEEWKFKNNDE